MTAKVELKAQNVSFLKSLNLYNQESAGTGYHIADRFKESFLVT